MKNLSEYIKEEVSVSIGTENANSNYATPGNTMGMGDLKPPTINEPGSDMLGKTEKGKKKKKKEKND
jgi:hypothetical protein